MLSVFGVEDLRFLSVGIYLFFKGVCVCVCVCVCCCFSVDSAFMEGVKKVFNIGCFAYYIDLFFTIIYNIDFVSRYNVCSNYFIISCICKNPFISRYFR